MFFMYCVKGKQIESEGRYKRNIIEGDWVVSPAAEHKVDHSDELIFSIDPSPRMILDLSGGVVA